jgi:hypothetical protein
MSVAARRRSSSLGCWDHGFECRSGHGCLSLCLYVVLSCVGRGLCDELITRPKESYHVSNKITKPQTGGHGPSGLERHGGGGSLAAVLA